MVHLKEMNLHSMRDIASKLFFNHDNQTNLHIEGAKDEQSVNEQLDESPFAEYFGTYWTNEYFGTCPTNEYFNDQYIIPSRISFNKVFIAADECEEIHRNRNGFPIAKQEFLANVLKNHSPTTNDMDSQKFSAPEGRQKEGLLPLPDMVQFNVRTTSSTSNSGAGGSSSSKRLIRRTHSCPSDFRYGPDVDVEYDVSADMVQTRTVNASLHTNKVGTSPSASDASPITANAISSMKSHLNAVDKSEKTTDLDPIEAPVTSLSYSLLAEKYTKEYEIEGRKILDKIDLLCKQALDFAETSRCIEGILSNQCLSLGQEMYDNFLDEINMVERYRNQGTIIIENIKQIQLSIRTMPDETPEQRFNRNQFLGSMFSEMDKQDETFLNSNIVSEPREFWPDSLLTPPPEPESKVKHFFPQILSEKNCEQKSKSPCQMFEPHLSLEVQIIDLDDLDTSLKVIPIGLRNTNGGTTCYINAGMQLLASVPQLNFCVAEGLEYWKKNGNKSLPASEAFFSFVKERNWIMSRPADAKERSIFFSPFMVTEFLFEHYPKQFLRSTQQDCVEFVTTFLDAIHGELGEEHSPVSKLFKGVQRRFLRKDSPPPESGEDVVAAPPECPEQEEFTSITLHFTSTTHIIEDCFSFYTSKQFCSEGGSLHWCLFEELPRLLLVHVLSFNECKDGPKKAMRKVSLSPVLLIQEEWMYQTAEKKVPEEQIPEEQVPEEQVPEEQVPEERVPEERVPEERVPEERVPEERVPEERVPEERVPEEQVPEEQVPEERVPEERVPEEPVSEKSVRFYSTGPNGTISFEDDSDWSDDCTLIEHEEEERVKLPKLPTRYNLRAVVLHSGQTTTSGHYTAVVSVPDSRGWRVWYHCDDDHVKKMNSLEDLNNFGASVEVTCLLYERE